MVTDEFGYWFAGLTDGEGSFGASQGKRPKYLPQPQFQIVLRADDRPLLEQIQKVLKVGALYERPAFKTPQGYISNPGVCFLANTREDTSELVKLFRRFPLRSKKAHDFELWAKIVEIRNSREWRGRITDEKMEAMMEARSIYEQLRKDRVYKS